MSWILPTPGFDPHPYDFVETPTPYPGTRPHTVYINTTPYGSLPLEDLKTLIKEAVREALAEREVEDAL